MPYDSESYFEYKELGLCPICHQREPQRGLVRCTECTVNNVGHMRGRYARAIQDGKCVRCLKPNPGDRRVCPSCLKATKAKRRMERMGLVGPCGCGADRDFGARACDTCRDWFDLKGQHSGARKPLGPHLIAELLRTGQMESKELAEALVTTKRSVLRLLAPLIAKGLVERDEDGDGGRGKRARFSLTKAAKAMKR